MGNGPGVSYHADGVWCPGAGSAAARGAGSAEPKSWSPMTARTFTTACSPLAEAIGQPGDDAAWLGASPVPGLGGALSQSGGPRCVERVLRA